MTTPIVAGTDGSERSLAAVEWAAREAARRRVPLCIVHAVDGRHGRTAARPQPLRYDLADRSGHELPHHARAALAGARRRAAEAAPGAEVHAAAVFGYADQVLTALTATAPLLVIGTRGAGGFPGLRVGSVALGLACRARCPVVFTPAESRPALREIVVGTDDGDPASAALEFGFGEAEAGGARLTALHAWADPRAGRIDGYQGWVLSVGLPNEDAAARLAGQVTPWRHRYPGVLVTEAAVHGHPGRVLVMASRTADLVVVGGCHDGPPAASGLGMVSYALLHHACCPVALIPQAARSSMAA
jgi:nucleotide-binding universal stress UspA family protein